MDEFFEDIYKIVETECKKIGKSIEIENKILMRMSYKCKKNCFDTQSPIEECEKCAEKCNTKIQALHDDINYEVLKVRKWFRRCKSSCLTDSGYTLTEEFKTCTNKCLEESLNKLKLTQDQAIIWANKYFLV